jgi:hypothetical protein
VSAIFEVLTAKNMNKQSIALLIYQNPVILGRTKQQLEDNFKAFESYGILSEKACKLLKSCPSITHLDLQQRLDEVHMVFNLYNGFEKEDTA